jgi:hypothetical protein
MADFKFKIVERFGVLSTTKAGWNKELNLVSFNDREPKLDIREWNPDHTEMGKGITLTREEADALEAILYKMLRDK